MAPCDYTGIAPALHAPVRNPAACDIILLITRKRSPAPMAMLFQTFAETLDALEPVTGRLQMVSMLADTLRQAEADEVAVLIYLTQGLLAPEFRQKEFGVNERLALRAIAQVIGVPAAETEQAFKRLGDIGLVAQEYSPANPERAQPQ